jgi:protein phosphatase PTC7
MRLDALRSIPRRHSPINLTCRKYGTKTPSRPFTFHVGASFLGKPEMDAPVDYRAKSNLRQPFPIDHPVVTFRDRMLSQKKEVPSDSAGQDFFYVTEVRRDPRASHLSRE